MLSFVAGVVIFLLLFIAKRTLVFVILKKKQVALSMAVIVLSELLMLFTLYISMDKYGLNSIKLSIGFVTSLMLMIVFYCVKFLAKGRERKDDGEL